MRYTQYTFAVEGEQTSELLETAYDLLSGMLAPLGFDSFQQEGTQLLAYIPTEDITADLSIEHLLADFPIPSLTFHYQTLQIEDINWNEEWEKNYFQPISLADGACIIRAPFHPANPQAEVEIIISPKMAFGTGNHETTSLIISHLLEATLAGKRVLDMGCGTGILGILALRRGAESLTAIDIDEWAYHNVLENAQLNGVHIGEVIVGDASSLGGLQPYDLVLANITRNILYADLPAYASVMKAGASIILSGFYLEDAPLLIERGAELGLHHVTTTERNRWAMLELRKA